MNRRAFSLIELVAVVLITGILVAYGAPKYVNSLHSYRGNATAKRIAADIEYAQLAAKRGNVSVTITFSLTDHHYILSGVAGFKNKSSVYQIEIDEEPYSGHIDTAVFNNNGSTDAEDAILVFDRFGTPDSGGAVTIHCGGTTKQINVNATTGSVTIQ
jgi:prepilin-type N-terminal cleavage/methylation domain-containing protein